MVLDDVAAAVDAVAAVAAVAVVAVGAVDVIVVDVVDVVDGNSNHMKFKMIESFQSYSAFSHSCHSDLWHAGGGVVVTVAVVGFANLSCCSFYVLPLLSPFTVAVVINFHCRCCRRLK